MLAQEVRFTLLMNYPHEGRAGVAASLLRGRADRSGISDPGQNRLVQRMDQYGILILVLAMWTTMIKQGFHSWIS